MRVPLVIVASLIALGILFGLAARPVSAQSPNLDDEVNRIAKTLYCPVCPNTPLDICNTQACADWRNDIKRMLREGKNEQQIREYFVARFGFQVLGAPPAEGFNWLAYILPAFGIVLGALVAWLSVRTWLVRRAPGAPPDAASEIPREYAERLKKELKES
ncbi:MAG: cytochrome c-type biogenesis protein CcmH [Anaerolineales bacterium]|nr:cytochrome c-type biogenesis protein CcmH [Anaerolineales bacterium]